MPSTLKGNTKHKVPSSLKIELSHDKMETLAEIAERKGLKPTQLARMWILEKLEELASHIER